MCQRCQSAKGLHRLRFRRYRCLMCTLLRDTNNRLLGYYLFYHDWLESDHYENDVPRTCVEYPEGRYLLSYHEFRLGVAWWREKNSYALQYVPVILHTACEIWRFRGRPLSEIRTFRCKWRKEVCQAHGVPRSRPRTRRSHEIRTCVCSA